MQFSKYTTAALVSVALCFSSTSAIAAAAPAAACQAGQPGCVLPVGEAAPPPVQVQTPPPVQTGPYVAPEVGGGGIGLFPILLGLAALAALYYFVIRNDDDDDDVVTPA
jgi:hypothetical protein